MHFFAVASGLASAAAVVPSAESGATGLVINGFWLVVELVGLDFLKRGFVVRFGR